MNLKQSNPLLLVIDMQNVYRPGKPWECPEIDKALANIKKLTDEKVTDNIISTLYVAPANPTGVWKSYNEKYREINEDEWLNAMCEEISDSLSKYPVYSKSTYSSCSVPEIKEKALAAPYVIITGVTTGCCVLSTVMNLIDLGVYVILLKDATAGTSEDCEQAVWTVLKELSPLHLQLMTTEEYLQQML